MKSVQISLKTALQVKKFVNTVQKYSFQINLRSNRYVVDAKSVLGIFSLDLAHPVNVEIYASPTQTEEYEELIESLKEFITD